MCVGSVCTHPSYNDKNPPSIFFLNPYFKIPFLKSGCSESPIRCLIIDCFYGEGEGKGKWCVAKYGDPYSEFVLCI